MNLKEIQDILEENFDKPREGKKRHIIYWYDAEGEFLEDINNLEISNAKIWCLKDNNNFKTKYQLEVTDPDSNYLLYSSNPMPESRENWLLDIIKYSQEFYANKTTIIMRDFDVEEEYMRPAFLKYSKFFNNKMRYERLKSYEIQEFNQEKLDIAILSALVKLNNPDLETAIKEILMEPLNESENSKWINIQKFGDEESVWELITKRYGYHQEEKSLKQLMLMLLITNLRHNLKIDIPATWKDYISTQESNSVVFLNHWMNHAKDYLKYDQQANLLEKDLKLKEYLEKWDIKNYLNCETFKSFDIAIIENLVDKLIHGSEEYDFFEEVISIRKTKHWYKYFKKTYDAIYWAIELLALTKKYNKNIPEDKPEDFFNKYSKEYHHFDRAYRRFYFAYDQAEDKERLRGIQEKIENLYSNWYIQELSIKFSNSLEDRKEWIIPGIKQQRDFYNNFLVNRILDDERVFVIISDGFRYEAAAELNQELKKEFKATTELQAIMGSLPGETSLGMASLLPNKEISFDKNLDKVLVDGIKINSSDNREKVLATYVDESIVLNAKEVKEMSRDDMRAALNGKKLVYIYHNLIDSIGESYQTEAQVFNAVNDTFKDIKDIIKALKYNVSATNIFITADHGFIYRRGNIVASDKTRQGSNDSEKESKRYIITESQEEIEGGIAFSLDYIIKDSKLKVVVPRAANRFQTRGSGLNYVHGGASLQEIVIPVIKFKNDRSNSERNESKKVDLKLTNISRKITNSIFHLEFFQTEKLSDKVLPRRLNLYFIDQEGEKISNENIIIADSSSDRPAERTYREKFTLKNREYQKDIDYYLILEDEEETVEKVYEKIPFKISLAITNDFDF
ncbi:BREX-1 system phosphatase PglZ type A [Natronospora cellulosivora (SeqCode)]